MSDYETSQRYRDITVGVFVLLALCALVWLVFKFGDLPTGISKFRSFQIFVQFPSAPGVQRDTPVRFTGYQIGRVTKVMPPQVREDKNTGLKYHQTMVVLSIDKKYVNIPSNVEVKLMTRGLGSSYIELAVDPLAMPAPNDLDIFLVNGMLLQGSTGMTSEFFPQESQEKLDELADGLKTLLDNANDILGDRENKENLKVTLANFAETSKQTTQALKEIQKFFASGTTTSEELGKIFTELRQILEIIHNGQGSAAKLISDGRLYENLLENARQLQLLIEELRSFTAKAKNKGLPIKLK